MHTFGEGFEWDPAKGSLNLRKHGVDFADAVEVFFDLSAVTIPDHDPHEERFVTMGMDTLGRVLVVVYSWRGDRIRLISARRAMPSERTRYQGKR